MSGMFFSSLTHFPQEIKVKGGFISCGKNKENRKKILDMYYSKVVSVYKSLYKFYGNFSMMVWMS